MFIYLGAPLGQVWVHDPWCDLAILRISNICKPPPKQFSGLRSKKYWVWQYDIWWFWTSRLNVSSKELDDAEKKDINPPRKKIENNVGNCHKPTMGMVFFAPITMVMTWGWFMALDLPHQFKREHLLANPPIPWSRFWNAMRLRHAKECPHLFLSDVFGEFLPSAELRNVHQELIAWHSPPVQAAHDGRFQRFFTILHDLCPASESNPPILKIETFRTYKILEQIATPFSNFVWMFQCAWCRRRPNVFWFDCHLGCQN